MSLHKPPMVNAEDPSPISPDYIFEVSWEVCNKIGGIHTLISTKATALEPKFHDRHLLIGPDIWKGTGTHPEFIEDKNLFKIWKSRALEEGLKIKIGKWNIPSHPTAILADFTPLFAEKDKILHHLWSKYGLDSLSGNWDYIEPVLFGHVAGKLIESFYRWHLNIENQVVAHFHEWLTGSGLLYLDEHAPQIAKVFTTHATVLGRSMASSGASFYQLAKIHHPDQIAKELNISAKHALEKISTTVTDSLTTVSPRIAWECENMLNSSSPMITPNGYNLSLAPPNPLFGKKRKDARAKLLQVASLIYGVSFGQDSLLLIKSGRYEFKNKGIDVFLDSLSEISQSAHPSRQILAFIFVPAHHTGPRKDLTEKMSNSVLPLTPTGQCYTHYLQGEENDPILQRLKASNLNHSDQVKVIYVPSYLDGKDGIFNLTYHDLLPGFDLGVFPSFYEPWGYTPLECLAFHVPAITSQVSGFGSYVTALGIPSSFSLKIIQRADSDQHAAKHDLAEFIVEFSEKKEAEISQIREYAYQISLNFSWSELIRFYEIAYTKALQKASKRKVEIAQLASPPPLSYTSDTKPEPQWRDLVLSTALPTNLTALKYLAMNLWWSWNDPVASLFEELDHTLWQSQNHNPLALLKLLDSQKVNQLSEDKAFLDKINHLKDACDNYLQKPDIQPNPKVAYFCMEYGLVDFITIYSGGLGILAGDFLKEASDSGIPVIGIGLFFSQGFFKQVISPQGDQIAQPDSMDLDLMPIHLVRDKDDIPVKLALPFPGRTLHAQAWQINVGKVPLYLLDTAVPENNEEDKKITAQLYNGLPDLRLQQEIVLGIGGVLLIEKLNLSPDIYHFNEGHAAFLGLARIEHLIAEHNLNFEEALEITKSQCLFTTHTAVPAAFESYSDEQLRPYFSHLTAKFDINWDTLMNLGRVHKDNLNKKFELSAFAMRLAQESNAVSRIHRKVSLKLFKPLWNSFIEEELPIGYIKNGIHFPTWLSGEWKKLRSESNPTQTDPNKLWDTLDEIPPEKITEVRLALKRRLIRYLRSTQSQEFIAKENPSENNAKDDIFFDENALFIGFARRMVEYKRPLLIFSDPKKLSALLNQADKPVFLFIAGKAHPQDEKGIALIKSISEFIQKPEFNKRVFFLEDYDMEIAKILVQGVDLWLNTPSRGLEASGTSGMKAMLNGVLNLSTMDGWWEEAYHESIGWAIPPAPDSPSTDQALRFESEMLYRLLEKEIIPTFFQKKKNGFSDVWISKIKASMKKSESFSFTRTLSEYNTLYHRLYRRYTALANHEFEDLKKFIKWKKHLIQSWSQLDVISVECSKTQNGGTDLVQTRVALDIADLSIDDLGVEVFFKWNDLATKQPKQFFKELQVSACDRNRVTFELTLTDLHSGHYSYSFRIFPKHPMLEKKQDFDLVKWI